MKKVTTTEAIDRLYRERVTELYEQARRYIETLNGLKGGSLSDIKLSFGGVARYGSLLAYYEPDARTIVVPTGNRSMSIARMSKAGVVPTRGGDQVMHNVLVHEFMHAADETPRTPSPHASEGWSRQICLMLERETGVKFATADMARILGFAHRTHCVYEHSARVSSIATRADPVKIKELASPGLLDDALAEAMLRDPSTEHRCVQCNAVMEIKRVSRRFCSPACRVKHHREHDTPQAQQERAVKAEARRLEQIEEIQQEIIRTESEIEHELRLAEAARAMHMKNAGDLREKASALRLQVKSLVTANS